MTNICTETRSLLTYFVRDACTDDIRTTVETHMQTCPECRSEFERLGGWFDKKGKPRVKQWSIGRVVSILAGCAVMFGAFVGLLNLFMMMPEFGKLQTISDFGMQMGRRGVSFAIFLAMFIGGLFILVALWQLLKFIYRKFLFPVREPEFETYSVQPGDTLVSIAQKQYGDGNATALLKFLNNSVEQAVSGQELRIRLTQ